MCYGQCNGMIIICLELWLEYGEFAVRVRVRITTIKKHNPKPPN